MEPQVNSIKDADAVPAFAGSLTSAMTDQASATAAGPSPAPDRQRRHRSNHRHRLALLHHSPTAPQIPTGTVPIVAFTLTSPDMPQPPFTLRWIQLITGWADDVEPTLMYRQGYFARATPERNFPTRTSVPHRSRQRNARTTSTTSLASGAQPAPQLADFSPCLPKATWDRIRRRLRPP